MVRPLRPQKVIIFNGRAIKREGGGKEPAIKKIKIRKQIRWPLSSKGGGKALMARPLKKKRKKMGHPF